MNHPSSLPDHCDVLIIGAGFAGLYLIYELRRLGLDVHTVEAGEDVGGTWFWNRYPGARCDVESVEYCYSFSKILDEEWSWSERYATQPEILRYLKFVAERLDLRRHITFGSRVEAAVFEEQTATWRVQLQNRQISARFCIMATGCLSVPNLPPIPGLEDFAGRILHTADWPRNGVDVRSRKVGVIGTGSSGCQIIPKLATDAQELVVFQRTANYCVPAENRSLDPQYYSYIKQQYGQLRDRWRATVIASSIPFGDRAALEVPEWERDMIYELRWRVGGGGLFTAFNDLFVNKQANDTAANFIRQKIRQIVRDPQTAADLCPADIPVGSKRVPLVTDYLESFNRPNVRLVSANHAPIDRVTVDGIVAGGEHIALDDLVFATGFDAITGAVLAIDIQGRGQRSLRDAWRDGPATYLGLMSANFPNLFLVTGPGSPSVLSNVVVSIEQHVQWISECIRSLKASGILSIEAQAEAQSQWMDQVTELAGHSLFASAKSWYSGDNIAGKPHAFSIYLGGVPAYKQKIDAIASSGYPGFTLTASPLARARIDPRISQ